MHACSIIIQLVYDLRFIVIHTRESELHVSQLPTAVDVNTIFKLPVKEDPKVQPE